MHNNHFTKPGICGLKKYAKRGYTCSKEGCRIRGYKDTWDMRIQVIRVYVGYVGYEDTCRGYKDTWDTRIQGIQGYVRYKGT